MRPLIGGMGHSNFAWRAVGYADWCDAQGGLRHLPGSAAAGHLNLPLLLTRSPRNALALACPCSQPPPEKSVAGAIRTLQEVGALTPAEELTPLGEQGAFVFSCPTKCQLRSPSECALML